MSIKKVSSTTRSETDGLPGGRFEQSTRRSQTAQKGLSEREAPQAGGKEKGSVYQVLSR